MKNIRINPFTGRTGGELMIVHRCLHCGRITCNRISGDDNPQAILCLLNNPANRNINGIALLSSKDKPQVMTALYGYGC